MLGLPKSTEFNKRIPKQKFYDNLTVSPTLKLSFVDQIRIIYWANKIAPSTLNLAEGKNVTEIEVFHIQLNQEILDENVLKQIDREIPYHILFVLEYDGKYKAVIGYKEAAGSGKASFKVDRYYQTEWLPETNLPVHLDGLNIDAVYENFVLQIAGRRSAGRYAAGITEGISCKGRPQRCFAEADKQAAGKDPEGKAAEPADGNERRVEETEKAIGGT